MTNQKNYKSSTLIKRFMPYYKPYLPTLIFDLFCASLTTLCEIILPLIMKQITDSGLGGEFTLTINYVVSAGLFYIALRIMVLTEDGVVEEGTHSRLVEQKGIYYRFYEMANKMK